MFKENENPRQKPILGRPKYNYGDVVRFHLGRTLDRNGDEIYPERDIVGTVEIIDPYGTFEQNEEPSYDILNKEKTMLYKHIREAIIVECIKKAGD